MNIETKNLCFAYKNSAVLNGIDFKASDGELVAFLGPNGVGKTTFFKCLLGFLRPDKPSVIINGKAIESYTRKQLAGSIAYIPQSCSPAFNHTVLDCVLMGMTNSIGYFESPDAECRKEALEILESLGIEHLANRGIIKISGGERQLTLLARALVQKARILIMDEPTANLDFGNSFRVMQRVSELKKQGYAVILSTHDPNLAIRFSSRIISMKNGKIIDDCAPSEFDSDTIDFLYGVKSEICPVCRGVSVK